MQRATQPYVTSGIALVGASLIAVTPVTLPPPDAQVRAVQLAADPYTDLFTNTVANLQNISDNADLPAISQVFSSLFTNPAGVIEAFTNITPDVTTDLTSLPATVSVELPPGLSLALGGLGADLAALGAVNGVATDLANGDFTGLLNAPATIANAYLNGADNISLLGGIINIPAINGLLAPVQNLDIDLNLAKLLDALGLGNLDLSNLNVSGLLDELGLGNLTLGSLLSELGISGDGLGSLLGGGSPLDLGSLLGKLGLDNLGLGSLGLGDVLNGLDLGDSPVGPLTLGGVLGGLGLDPGIGGIGLGSLLTDLHLNTLGLGTLLNGLPGLSPALVALLQTAVPLLNQVDLGTLLTGVHLGDGLSGNLGLSTLLDDLAVSGTSTDPSLTLTGLLDGLLGAGNLPSTGPLDLGGLLGGLNLDSLPVTKLLNTTLDLNGLLGPLLNTPLNLNSLVGDLSNLDLNGLLGLLGLDNLNLADISVGPLGGALTDLVDVVPQQIVAALAG